MLGGFAQINSGNCVEKGYEMPLNVVFKSAKPHFSARAAFPPPLLSQVGNNFTLARRVSPARFRILAWLVAVLLAVTCLLSEPRRG